jgi:hypothetical protein
MDFTMAAKILSRTRVEPETESGPALASAPGRDLSSTPDPEHAWRGQHSRRQSSGIDLDSYDWHDASCAHRRVPRTASRLSTVDAPVLGVNRDGVLLLNGVRRSSRLSSAK